MENFAGPVAGTKRKLVNRSTAIRGLRVYTLLIALPPRFLPASSGMLIKMITLESPKTLVVGL